MSGYPPQGGYPWEGTARNAEGGTGTTGGCLVLNDQGGGYMDVSSGLTATLRAENHGHPPLVFEPGAASRIGGHAWEDATGTLRADMGDNQMAVAIENHPTDGRARIDGSGKVQTLTSRMGTGGMNVPLVMGEWPQNLPLIEDVEQTLLSTDYKGTTHIFDPVPNPLVPATLKVRSGCEGGGKGALIQEDKSATLSCNNDQTVFVPKAYGICCDKISSMISDNREVETIEADTSRNRDNPSGSQECIATVEAVVGFDGYNATETGEVSSTLGSNCGISTGRQGVMYSLQGNMIGRTDENGPQGEGVNEDVSFTLNTIDRHAVAYSLDRASYNQGKNAQFDFSVREEQAQTLVAQGPSAVAQPASFYPYMKAESQCYRTDGKANTLVNGTCPGCHNGVVEDNTSKYIVRRLTPGECALLQGFPKNWCTGLDTPNPTEQEIEFFAGVFETKRKILGTGSKPKTRSQIIKWLRNPYSDAAEYKMWGNGVALPCVCFVLAGIVWSNQKDGP